MFKYIPFVLPWDKGLEGAKWGLQDRWGESREDSALFLPSQWSHFCFSLGLILFKTETESRDPYLVSSP